MSRIDQHASIPGSYWSRYEVIQNGKIVYRGADGGAAHQAYKVCISSSSSAIVRTELAFVEGGDRETQRQILASRG